MSRVDIKWSLTLQQLGPGAVGEIVANSPALQAAIAEERGDVQPARNWTGCQS